jgi:hypothetical protein
VPHLVRHKENQKATNKDCLGGGQHAGMAETYMPDLGNERDSNRWVNIPEWSNTGTTIHHLYGVGQHPRMVGQHKTEGWVNMGQNIQLRQF